MRFWAAVAVMIFASAARVVADVPFLALPIDCDPGRSCFIQNYVDHDPGPNAQDFTCSGLTYDGHKGTDFALPTLQHMKDGVAVLAAAPGTVIAVRDGEPDTGAASFAAGKDCGNGVVIDHGGGWQTQYCHMKQGTLRARVGQRVATGTVLGDVGLSGRTEFPHLHLSLRRDGDVVDPFDETPDATCGAQLETLWRDPPHYEAGGLIEVGFHMRVPSYDAIKAGHAGHSALDIDAPALVLWGYAFGGRKGDTLRLSIDGPTGPFSDQTVTLEKAQAQFFRASGRKFHAANRVAGTYRGTVELIRGGHVIDTAQTRVTLGD